MFVMRSSISAGVIMAGSGEGSLPPRICEALVLEQNTLMNIFYATKRLFKLPVSSVEEGNFHRLMWLVSQLLEPALTGLGDSVNMLCRRQYDRNAEHSVVCGPWVRDNRTYLASTLGVALFQHFHEHRMLGETEVARIDLLLVILQVCNPETTVQERWNLRIFPLSPKYVNGFLIGSPNSIAAGAQELHTPIVGYLMKQSLVGEERWLPDRDVPRRAIFQQPPMLSVEIPQTQYIHAINSN
jgi:hypothetical protein